MMMMLLQSRGQLPSLLPLQGPLFRWTEEGGSGGKPYWAQRYFLLQQPQPQNNKNQASATAHRGGGGGGGVLHQYDNERQAQQKSDTATKKNRLHITPGDCNISTVLQVPHNDDDPMHGKTSFHAFTITILNGRIEWKLAATTKADQEKWVSTLSSLFDPW